MRCCGAPQRPQPGRDPRGPGFQGRLGRLAPPQGSSSSCTRVDGRWRGSLQPASRAEDTCRVFQHRVPKNQPRADAAPRTGPADWHARVSYRRLSHPSPRPQAATTPTLATDSGSGRSDEFRLLGVRLPVPTPSQAGSSASLARPASFTGPGYECQTDGLPFSYCMQQKFPNHLLYSRHICKAILIPFRAQRGKPRFRPLLHNCLVNQTQEAGAGTQSGKQWRVSGKERWKLPPKQGRDDSPGEEGSKGLEKAAAPLLHHRAVWLEDTPPGQASSMV
ncbi:uncharacterized protein LOC104862488 [Fukomys damarensis]|uniref:uncharacterized protein LOC104862488 n=1 Tax=Fukomys damarensis TaxID=885580 RepID=UPI00053FA128|nr:uncharacterized protein LOC104862488 [Fukomys damarensis]